MPRDTGKARFDLNDNRLTVEGEFGPEDEKAYSEALFELLNCGRYQLEIDLTGLHYLSSSYIGATSLAVMMAKQSGRSVTIITNKEIARILHMVGVDAMTEVEVVGD